MSEMEKLPMSPYGDYLGISIDEYKDGIAKCSVEIKPFHLNNGGRVHGGLLTSLADTAAGVAVRTIRPEGMFSATTDMNISFIRPPKGDSLQAVAKVIHAGKKLFHTEIVIYCEAKLVAKTNATFMIVEAFKEK